MTALPKARHKRPSEPKRGASGAPIKSLAEYHGGDITFTLPEPPSANRWWRKWRNRMVLSAEARAYKSMVCRTYRGAELRGAVAVTIHWHRGRKSGDLDKRLGVVLDALQGVAYGNDSQITRLTALRIESPRNPHVVVCVSPALSPSQAPAPRPFVHCQTCPTPNGCTADRGCGEAMYGAPPTQRDDR